MKNKLTFIAKSSLGGIFVSLFFLAYTYLNKTINLQAVSRNTIAIMFFLGILFFYQFYRIKKFVYISFFLLFMCICLSFSYFIIFKSMPISLVFFVGLSIYFIYKVGDYLFDIDDVAYLRIMTKLLFFNESYKYNLAWKYYNEGNYNRSIKILKKCRSNNSYFLLANNYEQNNEYEKAIELYTKILLNDKNERSEILYNRGAKYKKLGKYDEAINDFIACINCQKPEPKAYIALGVIKDELGEYEEAKKYFLKGSSFDNMLDEYIPEKYKM